MSHEHLPPRPDLPNRSWCAFATASALALVVGSSCAGPPQTQGLSVVAPTTLGEGHNEHAGRARSVTPAPSAAGAGSVSAPSASGVAANRGGAAAPATSEEHDFGAQPDPAPLVTAHQWDLTLHYSRGKVSLVGEKPVELRAAIPTPRQMGRFAVELWVGKELVDRVRFEFPLLGADFAPSPGTRQTRGTPRFSMGADTVTTVRVPSSDRATSARVVDRLTGAVVSIPWPPSPPGAPALLASPPTSSSPAAGSPSATPSSLASPASSSPAAALPSAAPSSPPAR